jgi:signal transduction histidine kinase
LGRADLSTLTQSEPLDLVAWLIKFMENRADHDRSSDIVVHPSTQESLCIKAQPHLLGQLVENLLDNACKYSCPGTAVVVSTAGDGGSALIMVEDSGSGIAQEDLARVFEPFFRSSSTSHQKVPGAGLGLSVVERIVRAFGGTIIARSELGRGSRFEVRLPIAELSDQEQFALLPSRSILNDAVAAG